MQNIFLNQILNANEDEYRQVLYEKHHKKEFSGVCLVCEKRVQNGTAYYSRNRIPKNI